MKDNDWIERQRKAGYVRREVFANLCGRGDGGNITELAQKYGVDVIFKKMGGKTGREIPMFFADDAHKIPSADETALKMGGQNGGQLRHEISLLRKRISYIEKELDISHDND